MSGFNTANFTFVDFTEMNESQSLQVLECRNNPEIRTWMVNTDIISAHNHSKFIKSLSENKSKLYFIVLYRGQFIGSINIHIEDSDKAERGIYIHPQYWGKKFALNICKEFYKYIHDNLGINIIYTKVKKENKGSNALESALGAKLSHDDASFFYYSCDLTAI